MKELKIKDVRSEMPNYAAYRDKERQTSIAGIAIHHSATANAANGLSLDNALSIFRYHVDVRGWDHGGYHYLVHPNGLIEYALDVKVAAYHAGFHDPDDTMHLERGQYWNNHFLAVCLLGWFEKNRTIRDQSGSTIQIPDHFVHPTTAQFRALMDLLHRLLREFSLPVDTVFGHRELRGTRTVCPGGTLTSSLCAVRCDPRR